MPSGSPAELRIYLLVMLLTSYRIGKRPTYKHVKIWGVRVYIINGRVKIKHIDDIPHYGYFMGYASTKVAILYWNPDQPFIIHIPHHVCF